MRIAIIGRSQLLYRTAELLIDSNFKVVLIVTAKEAPEYTKTAKDFELLANKIGAKFIYTPKINLIQHVNEIKGVGIIDLAVSINYTGVISQEVIDLFPLGILNAHAGDLPRYRGNAPLAWAIINKEERVGLCIHKMIGGELDSGDIFARDYQEIHLETRVGQLLEWIEFRIPLLMLEAINKIRENPDFRGLKQSTDPKLAMRCYPRRPEDGAINWSMSNLDILRLINASSEPFSGAYTTFQGEEMKIWRASFFEDEEVYSACPGQIASILTSGEVVIITGQGKLVLNYVEYKGVKGLPSEFIKSIRTRLV